MSTTADQPLESVAPPAAGGEPDWQRDKQDREYIRAKGRRGIIYRQGDESAAAALARDRDAQAQPPGDRRPRPKRKRTPPKPAPPESVDLKALEKVIADALQSPAAMCAMFGDEWAAEHFTKVGPHVARNLVRTAEHNPWLRKKLEAWAAGGELPMQFIALLGVGGSLALYLAPPIIYWFNLPVPTQARVMLDIPPRREKEPDEPAGPEPATFPAAA